MRSWIMLLAVTAFWCMVVLVKTEAPAQASTDDRLARAVERLAVATERLTAAVERK